MVLEIGRVCMKIAGREASKYCVVVKRIDDSFVEVSGPRIITGVKKRRCNVNHLEPTQETFDVKTGDDSELENLWKKSDLIKKFNIEIPKKKKVKKEKGE